MKPLHAMEDFKRDISYHVQRNDDLIVLSANLKDRFHDIRMEIKEGSALEAKDSKRISYDKITVSSPVLNIPYLKLTNCQNVQVTNCYQAESIPLFINEDEKSSDIYVMNNILPGTTALTNKKGKNIVVQNNVLK